ncbi:MAG: linear amide C-N hydrolase [Anaerolineales bacterium]|nr:linear amide C-N hydrolase [Anaerolineales bacterium]
MTRACQSSCRLFALILTLVLSAACSPPSTPAAPSPATQTALHTSPTVPPPATLAETSQAANLSAEQIATLDSLEKVDDFPLYTMHYYGDYRQDLPAPRQGAGSASLLDSASTAWGCSLFAALGDPAGMLFGRSFDWQFSPAVLLFTHPQDGYASVSMVDFAYFDVSGNQVHDLAELPLEQRQALLEAPTLPFDGMNERGLAVGMAAVPEGNMPPDPAKETISSILVIRLMLDRAQDVGEALAILESYNLDYGGGPPLHYLLADASGRSMLVEFYQGEMHLIPNQNPWQQATNFLVSSTSGSPGGNCRRYDRIEQALAGSQGRLDPLAAMELLSQVAQDNTQWSVVYGLQSGEVAVVMGREYENIHHFELSQE